MHPVTLHSAAYAAADVHSNPNRQSVGAGWYVCAHLWRLCGLRRWCAKLRTIIHITPRAPVHCDLQPVNVNVF